MTCCKCQMEQYNSKHCYLRMTANPLQTRLHLKRKLQNVNLEFAKYPGVCVPDHRDSCPEFTSDSGRVTKARCALHMVADEVCDLIKKISYLKPFFECLVSSAVGT